VRPQSYKSTSKRTSRGQREIGKMSATMSSSILDMTGLMHRVDDDRELLAELFFILKTVFPAHLERLSDAVARNESN
jgi:hypothetical protein